MSHRVAGRCHQLHAGHELLAVLDELDALAQRRQRVAGALDNRLDRFDGEIGLVGPEGIVSLSHVDLRVREVGLAAFGHEPPAMIRMCMGEDDGVDILGIGTGGFERGRQAAGIGSEELGTSHAGVEQNQPVAAVHHQCIDCERDLFIGKVVVAENLRELLLGCPRENVGRLPDAGRPSHPILRLPQDAPTLNR